MRLSGMTVDGILTELASESPAPGGGSAAALAAAVAASLCAMVARIALSRETLRDRSQAMEAMLGRATRSGERLRALVDEDAAAYLAVVDARRLPKSSGAERSARERAIADATRRAAAVPLETLRVASEVAGLAREAAERGAPACLTDAGSAAELARAAATAASYNVRVNLPSLPDAAERDRLERETAVLLAAAREAADRTRLIVEERLGGPR